MPWSLELLKKYKKEMQVEGVIIKFNKHGALASIEEGIAGLVHISEFGSEEKLRKTLELGKSYNFKITNKFSIKVKLHVKAEQGFAKRGQQVVVDVLDHSTDRAVSSRH